MPKNATRFAVIGMSARFPGARTIDQYWKNIRDGVESVESYSVAEVVAAGIPRHIADSPDYVRAGAAVPDMNVFDAEFFDIPPQEAKKLDPQQRLFLECAWECLEDCGCAGDVKKQQIGVFAGSRISEYMLYRTGAPDLYGFAPGSFMSNWHTLICNDKDFLTTLASYKLDLTGPSINVQTACSTSLVAVHMACRSLLMRECDVALAGGCCIRPFSASGYVHMDGIVLSQDGHTRPFDTESSGTVFTSGLGLVALKRLEDARADGDQIYAIVRATAVNNDGAGRKQAFTGPDVKGQTAVVTAALRAGDVHPDQIGYVEAHGTATPIGDKVEIEALTAAFRQSTDRKGYCAVGSVKSNIGHTLQAAGIAGFIKTVMMLRHGLLPPTLNCREINPAIGFAKSPFYVNRECRPWPRTDSPRIAAVSSFGVGGTNAHVILEQAPTAVDNDDAVRGVNLLCLSAKSQKALERAAVNLSAFLENRDDVDLNDLCFSANTGRRHFDHRLALTVDATSTAVDKLRSIAFDATTGSWTSRHGKIAFLFTGLGAEHRGMGQALFHRFPAYREALKRCDAVLAETLGMPVSELLYRDSAIAVERFDQTDFRQPALFAVQYAIVELLKSLGIVPDAVVGHSFGEFAAACAAGVLSETDTASLVNRRGQLMQRLPPGGGMLVTRLSPEAAARELTRYPQLAVAALNGPDNTVVAGPGDALDVFAADMKARHIDCRRLAAPYAFHTSTIGEIVNDLHDFASGLTHHEPERPFYSTLTGGRIPGSLDPDYWRRHACSPVRFSDAFRALTTDGFTKFIEIGPDPVLLGMGRNCHDPKNSLWLPTLRQDRDACEQLFESLATLYGSGIDVDWRAFHRGRRGRRISLPTYPFERERHWIERVVTQVGNDVVTNGERSGNPLLRTRLDSPLADAVFETVLSLEDLPWLAGHRVADRAVFPATGFLEMAFAAAGHVREATSEIRDVTLLRPLFFSEPNDVHIVQVIVQRDGCDHTIEIHSRADTDEQPRGAWTLHVTARATDMDVAEPGDPVDLAATRKRLQEAISLEAFRKQRIKAGLDHGGQFLGLNGLWRSQNAALGRISPLPTTDARSYYWHPAIADACLHPAGAFTVQDDAHLYLPAFCDRVRYYGPPSEELWCLAELRTPDTPELRTVDYTITDPTGRRLLEVSGLRLRQVEPERFLSTPSDSGAYCFRQEWRVMPQGLACTDDRLDGCWIVFADRLGFGHTVARAMRQRGARVAIITTSSNGAPDAEEYTVITPDDISTFSADLDGMLQGHTDLTGVVYCWALDVPAYAPATSGDAARAALLTMHAPVRVIQAILRVIGSRQFRCCFVSRGAQRQSSEQLNVAPEQAPLWGIARVAAREHPELGLRLLDVDPETAAEDTADLVPDLLRTPTGATELLCRNSNLYERKIVDYRDFATLNRQIHTEPVALRIGRSGSLDSLHFVEAHDDDPQADDIRIRVVAVGLNFRDVLNALGQYPGDAGPLGFECAGIVIATGPGVGTLSVGDPVVARASGCFASYVNVSETFAAKIPGDLTFAQAASVPVAFMTAYHALINLAKIGPGARVLIHAASGGVGSAAVQLARMAGAEIFATASSPKWRYVQSIGAHHVMNSRDLDFATQVLDSTNGDGVNVVLNSLAGDFINESVRVLASDGCFIEIGKTGIWDRARFAQVRPSGEFHHFDLGAVLESEPSLFADMFTDIAGGLVDGALRLSPIRCFPAESVVDAFRHMSRARHIGKIVVTFTRPDGGARRFDPNGAYLVTGAFGGLGRVLIPRMAAAGARHLVLNGRSAAPSSMLDDLRKTVGNDVHLYTMYGDISDFAQAQALVAEIERTLPPLRGIAHAAGVLDDALISDVGAKHFERVSAAKIHGSRNLHELTSRLDLDWFVLFSSTAAIFGNPGQAAYAAANAYMDSLAQYRQTLGLAATSINWGAWDEVGMAATEYLADRRKLTGGRAMPTKIGAEIFELAVTTGASHLIACHIDWDRFRQHLPGSHRDILADLCTTNSDDSGRKTPPSHKPLLRPDMSADALSAALEAFLVQLVSKHVGVAPDSIAPDKALRSIGIDSLTAIELRHAIDQAVGIRVTAPQLFELKSVGGLRDFLAEQILGKFVREADPAAIEDNDVEEFVI